MKSLIQLSIIVVATLLSCNTRNNNVKEEVHTDSGNSKHYSVSTINGEYIIDTAVILSNQNLDDLLNEIDQIQLTAYNKYSFVPKTVKSFLESLTKGAFEIADPGKPWDVGCIKTNLPDRQLIYSGSNDHYFVMSYWIGGIGKMGRIVLIKFENNHIIDFWTGKGGDFNSKESILQHLNTFRNKNKEFNSNFISI